MKHIAAYILAVLGGNASPSADDVTAIVTAAGGEVDEDSLTKMMGDLEGKDVAELMLAGKTRLVETMGSAVMAAGGGGGGAAAGDAAGGAAAEEEPEPEPEPEEEIDLGGGMDMFGGGEADY